MKTWHKIAVVITVLVVGVIIYLYIAGEQAAGPSDQPQRDNPVFSFDAGDGEGFFSTSSDQAATTTGRDDATIADKSSLWQASDAPVAGSEWVAVATSSKAMLWYVRADNGHVYQSTPEERTPTRLTNTTIPRVQEALIAPDGSFIVYRYRDDVGVVKTYLARLMPVDNDDVPYRITGEFLADDIETVAVGPNSERVFYIQPTSSGVAGVVFSLAANSSQVIFESAVTEWHAQWEGEGGIVLTTAPAREATGFSYLLNPTTGRLEKLAEGDGLLARLSHNGQYLLTSSFNSSGGYHGQVTARTASQAVIMSPRTLADKCGWAVGITAFICGVPQQLPRNPLRGWYQGKISFSDTLVLFNPSTRSQSALLNESIRESGPFDITSISTDQNFRYGTFTNRRSGHLWAFEL